MFGKLPWLRIKAMGEFEAGKFAELRETSENALETNLACSLKLRSSAHPTVT
jgi:hypothetical protein